MGTSTFRVRISAVAAVTALMAVAGCASGGGAEDGQVEITWLTDNSEQGVETAEAIITAFEAAHPDIMINHDTRPSGTEGDNLVKTRLSTAEMAEVFTYNSGSLLQALNPDQNLVELSDQPWVADLTDDFVSVVSTQNGLYGAPYGTSFGGGIVYNQAIYEDLGLERPKSWDEFMANNQAIADADLVPIIQTYGDTWTSQLFVLGDYANVHAADPEWAEQYTAHQRFYAQEPALAGFRHHQEVHEAGFFNEDYPSATFDDGARMLAERVGVHYPILTTVIDTISSNYPDAVDDMRFMAIPADDASLTSATIWQPSGMYISATTEGAKLDASLALLEFVNSAEACEIFNTVGTPTGPYANSCELPEDVPPLLQDIQTYVDEANTTPALEFLSPIKGPNLENITVEVGSGIRGAEEAAANYDRDVENQAKQLGIEGW